jgi:hypothetical protein
VAKKVILDKKLAAAPDLYGSHSVVLVDESLKFNSIGARLLFAFGADEVSMLGVTSTQQP